MKTSIGSSMLIFIILALQGGFAQSAGDGSIVPLPEEDRLAIEKYLGKGVVGEAIPAPALADTTRYLNIGVGSRNFRVVSGPNKGKMEHHQITPMKQGAEGATWQYDTGARFIFLITAKANGDYIVTGVTDNEEGVITQYSPGEPLMLQGLAPGEERKTTHDMKVFDLSNPDKQTHAGTLDINYRYVGAYKVTVPAGTFDAVLIKWTFKGKIGPASLNDTQYRLLVADVGVVAAVEQMDVSAMLIYNKQRKVARVLAEKPKS
jgi:hypothetical protein